MLCVILFITHERSSLILLNRYIVFSTDTFYFQPIHSNAFVDSSWISFCWHCNWLVQLFGCWQWHQHLFWLVSFYFFRFACKWMNMTLLCMTQGLKHWKRCTLIGDALCAALWHSPHSTWSNSTFLALKLSIMILMVLHGSNVISVTPPFIYSVGHGRQKELSGQNAFYVPFSAVDSSKCVRVSLARCSVHGH